MTVLGEAKPPKASENESQTHTACGILRNFAYTHRKIANYATVAEGERRFRVPKLNFLLIFIFRGVAKVVSRQFRVLETVGSSPAASTKKRRQSLAGCLRFFSFGRIGEGSNPPRAPRFVFTRFFVDICSH